jgi:hypothetical protein
MDYTHVITDAVTGEVTIIPFTQEEIDAYEAAQVEVVVDPIEKLKNFLEQNPDVASLLG